MQVDRRDFIQKEYILLDWNVIKYLKEPRDSIDEDAKNLMVTVQKRYEIPFCEAHLRDRARGFSEKNKERVHEDLDFLQTLSKGVAIGSDGKDNYYLINSSVYDLFQEIINEEPRTPDITSEMNPQSIFKVDMQKLDEDHPMRKMLETTEGIIEPGIMAKWLNDMYDPLFNEIDDYKKYREYIKKIKRDLRENSQGGLLPGDQIYKEWLSQHMMPFIDLLDIEDEEELRISWKTAITKWLQMRYRNTIPLGELITTSYVMLDLHPLFREKLKKKKNTLSNIARDSKAILYASNSKFFITEDNNCYEKAKFVFSALEIKTKTLKISEFVSRFS